jgi:hypothetical protein
VGYRLTEWTIPDISVTTIKKKAKIKEKAIFVTGGVKDVVWLCRPNSTKYKAAGGEQGEV